MKLEIKNQHIAIVEREPLVSGTVNVYTAEFSFDAAWDGYTPVAVFEGSGIQVKESREAVITDNRCTIPWETLLPNGHLRIGVYGVSGDQRLPTIYTERLFVARGTEPAEQAAEPTPGVVEQFAAQTAADREAASNAAAQAKADAAQATQIAAEMAILAEQVGQDTATAAQAREDAQTAQSKAQTAQQAAETARQAAEDAAGQVSADASAASAAAARAEAAANQAAAALAELQALYQEMREYVAQAIQAIQNTGSVEIQSIADTGAAQLQAVENAGAKGVQDIEASYTGKVDAINTAGDTQVERVTTEGTAQVNAAKTEADRSATEADRATAARKAVEAASYLTDERDGKAYIMAWGVNADGFPTLTLTEKEKVIE